MNDIKVSILDLLRCLSRAQDLVNTELSRHHQQVAYLAFRLAERMGLGFEEKKHILLAGLLHDIGALALNENLEKIDDESSMALNHGYFGSALLRGFKPLEKAAEIIKYHHHRWDYGKVNRDIPMASHMIHVADRMCVLLKTEQNILPQVKPAFNTIKAKSGSYFNPELVDCLEELTAYEYIWLDLTFSYPMEQLSPELFVNVEPMDLDQIIDFSKIFSRIIDYRSTFTANHSSGVAKTAERLAQIFGYSDNECKMMLVAGYLHDLGKLAIPNAILEKPGKLTPEEFCIIKSHPFYTHRILSVINGFEIISQWAAYHHERPNGTGYPFHLCDHELPLGSRIAAVADVFTAITEDRPYRAGMTDRQCITTLQDMIKKGDLCPKVSAALLDHYTDIKELCRYTQACSKTEYQQFKHSNLTEAAALFA